MEREFTPPPQLPNYAEMIAQRLDGQDEALREIVGWAREMNQLMTQLVDQQKTQAALIERLVKTVGAPPSESQGCA